MNNRGRAGKAVLLAVILFAAAACAPITRPPGEPINRPLLAGDFFHTADGLVLPVKSWRPQKDPPRAVLIALHGFNDYSNFFAEPGASSPPGASSLMPMTSGGSETRRDTGCGRGSTPWSPI